MRLMTCAEVDELATELAFDLLDGEERGCALAHIEGCHACRLQVTRATEMLEALLLLTPPVTPPEGFGRRVLERVAAESKPPRRTWPQCLRGSGAFAAAVLLALGVALLAFSFGRGSSGTASALATTMRTPAGEHVGTAYVHPGSPGWILLDIPDWETQLAARYAVDRRYAVRIERRDGTTSTSRTRINDDGTWATSHRSTSAIGSISVVDDQGRTWCTGRFAS